MKEGSVQEIRWTRWFNGSFWAEADRQALVTHRAVLLAPVEIACASESEQPVGNIVGVINGDGNNGTYVDNEGRPKERSDLFRYLFGKGWSHEIDAATGKEVTAETTAQAMMAGKRGA